MSKILETRIAKLEKKTATNNKMISIEINGKILQISTAKLSNIIKNIKGNTGLPILS